MVVARRVGDVEDRRPADEVADHVDPGDAVPADVVAAAVIRSEPKTASTWAVQEPSAPAVVVSSDEPALSLPTRLTSTVAPGVAVPVTVVEPETVSPAWGVSMVTGTARAVGGRRSATW